MHITNHLVVWAALAGVIALAVSGCGSGVYDVPAGRPSMSNVCEACYWLEDGEIEERVYATELARSAGISGLEALGVLIENCEEAVEEADSLGIALSWTERELWMDACRSCSIQIIEAVY